MSRNHLSIQLQLRNNPYQEEIQAQFEVWGRLYISIHVEDSQKTTPLLTWEWNLLEFIMWFVQAQPYFPHNELLIQGQGSRSEESLAQALNRLQDRDVFSSESEEDQWFDALHKYRMLHSLRFALRGSNVPPIIIGLNQGRGEISLDDKERWCYHFDMKQFCQDVRQNCIVLLAQVAKQPLNAYTHQHVTAILEELGNLHE